MGKKVVQGLVVAFIVVLAKNLLFEPLADRMPSGDCCW
jgi:hypothetical protein